MLRILFVCHGNICRSPMAEFVLNYLAEKHGLGDEIYAESAAVSREEIGNDIHPGTAEILKKYKIPYHKRSARQITPDDYDNFDLIIGMDRYNISGMRRIFGGDPDKKVEMLLKFAGQPGREVDDPWYTGDFETAYYEIKKGCEGIIKDYLGRRCR